MAKTSTKRSKAESALGAKGERTRGRILDAAEVLFAAHGFEGASLRAIAAEVGIREPGLYNYFAGKEALYAAVLDRALRPIADLLDRQLAEGGELADLPDLPIAITDLLCEHPRMSALFQQALQGDAKSPGNRLTSKWLERLFARGVATARSGGRRASSAESRELAILVIAMFNLSTGYFLAQRAFDTMAKGAGRLTDPENLAVQKRLLSRIVRAASPGASPGTR